MCCADCHDENSPPQENAGGQQISTDLPHWNALRMAVLGVSIQSRPITCRSAAPKIQTCDVEVLPLNFRSVTVEVRPPNFKSVKLYTSTTHQTEKGSGRLGPGRQHEVAPGLPGHSVDVLHRLPQQGKGHPVGGVLEPCNVQDQHQVPRGVVAPDW